MNTTTSTCLVAGLAALTLLTSGCGKAPAPQSSAPTASVPPAITSVFQPVATTEAMKPIPELRAYVAPGDTVILEAKVMGTETPFVDHRALFVVGDEATLTSCDLREDDHCSTPWDNCCDDPHALRIGTATIQIVDAEGNVVKHGIRGVNGLRELSRVRIRGVVAPQSTGDALIINATGIELL